MTLDDALELSAYHPGPVPLLTAEQLGVSPDALAYTRTLSRDNHPDDWLHVPVTA